MSESHLDVCLCFMEVVLWRCDGKFWDCGASTSDEAVFQNFHLYYCPDMLQGFVAYYGTRYGIIGSIVQLSY